MFPGYHLLLREQALKALLKPVDMPEPVLGVGFAEVLTPQAIRFRPGSVKTKVKVDQERTQTLEDIAYLGKGTGAAVAGGDFPREYWFGDALGVV